MPFISERPLQDMLDPSAVEVAGLAMTAKGGRALAEETQLRTPVYKGPPRRDGRLPGTLRDSIKAGAVRRHSSILGRGWEIRVSTDDPVGPNVEWTTRPHDIPNAFGFGDAFGLGGRFDGKFHPGTQGHHMFSRAAAALEVEIPFLFRDELEQFGRDLTLGREGRFLNPVAKDLDSAIQKFMSGQRIATNG